MTSRTTEDFRRLFARLPVDVQNVALRNYRLWRSNPSHRSLGFKRVHPVLPVYSVRVGLNWRAAALREDDVLIWFWIGSHADYDKLLGEI